MVQSETPADGRDAEEISWRTARSKSRENWSGRERSAASACAWTSFPPGRLTARWRSQGGERRVVVDTEQELERRVLFGLMVGGKADAEAVARCMGRVAEAKADRPDPTQAPRRRRSAPALASRDAAPPPTLDRLGRSRPTPARAPRRRSDPASRVPRRHRPQLGRGSAGAAPRWTRASRRGTPRTQGPRRPSNAPAASASACRTARRRPVTGAFGPRARGRAANRGSARGDAVQERRTAGCACPAAT